MYGVLILIGASPVRWDPLEDGVYPPSLGRSAALSAAASMAHELERAR
jgi:hypothetical protein